MERATDSCPYPEATRALRCQSCTANNHGLPPCALTWLATRLGRQENLSVIRLRESPKAA